MRSALSFILMGLSGCFFACSEKQQMPPFISEDCSGPKCVVDTSSGKVAGPDASTGIVVILDSGSVGADCFVDPSSQATLCYSTPLCSFQIDSLNFQYCGFKPGDSASNVFCGCPGLGLCPAGGGAGCTSLPGLFQAQTYQDICNQGAMQSQCSLNGAGP